MVQAPSKQVTLAAFLSMPETKPASELIDGAIVQKPMPQGKHSAVQSELVPIVNGKLRRKQIARAFSELRCTFGGRSTVPDIAVFVWERIVCDATGEIANAYNVAPDWTIEILSPDQSQTKVVKNIIHCLQHGSVMGWLIDPEERTVFVYYPSGVVEVFEQADDRLPVPGFAVDLSITIEQLFECLVK